MQNPRSTDGNVDHAAGLVEKATLTRLAHPAIRSGHRVEPSSGEHHLHLPRPRTRPAHTASLLENAALNLCSMRRENLMSHTGESPTSATRPWPAPVAALAIVVAVVVLVSVLIVRSGPSSPQDSLARIPVSTATPYPYATTSTPWKTQSEAPRSTDSPSSSTPTASPPTGVAAPTTPRSTASPSTGPPSSP